VIIRDGTATAKLVQAPAPSPVSPGTREWKLGLHPGAMVMREDFNDPLDEDNWEDG
jgi:antitoxin (DNA-binding transcriptional repressor) of toxin-antitoxin stability system